MDRCTRLCLKSFTDCDKKKQNEKHIFFIRNINVDNFRDKHEKINNGPGSDKANIANLLSKSEKEKSGIQLFYTVVTPQGF